MSTDTEHCSAISIHAPRTGSDLANPADVVALRKFQSTLPARGATHGALQRGSHRAFQSTLPARGATACVTDEARVTGFQSTLPARGATRRELFVGD